MVAAFASLAAGSAQGQDPGPSPKPISADFLNWSISSPARAFRVVQRSGVAVAFQSALRINTEDNARDVVVASELAGVHQIRRLLQSTAVEEAWAYVPQAGLWIEIGVYGRDDGALGPLVEIDVALLGRLVAAFDRVDLYHLHPRSTFSAGFGIAGVYPSATPVGSLNADGQTTVGLATPSPGDIESAIQIGLLQEKLHPSSDVRNYLVSPYGVVEYELTPSGRKEIALNQGNPLRSLERTLITMNVIRRAPYNIQQTAAKRPRMPIAELIDTLCDQLTGDNLVVRQVESW